MSTPAAPLTLEGCKFAAHTRTEGGEVGPETVFEYNEGLLHE